MHMFSVDLPEKKGFQSWRSEGRAGWLGIGVILIQLLLVVGAAHLFRIEEGRGFVGKSGDLFGSANLLALTVPAYAEHDKSEFGGEFHVSVSVGGCV